MAKFKVGDRIRCTDRDAVCLTYGKIYTVSGLHRNRTTGEVNGVTFDDESGWHYDWRFEPVEPLKLEKGSIVRLKDGVDEWEVTQVYGNLGYNSVGLKRGDYEFCAYHKDVVVVKEKPEPPKPDFYTNCKGVDPQDGDVFRRNDNNAIWVAEPERFYCVSNHYAWDRSDRNPHRRTLLVRDGKSYTG